MRSIGPAYRLVWKVTCLYPNVSLENRPAGCILPKASRRDAGDPLKMKTQVALTRETGAERDLGQTESAICSQESDIRGSRLKLQVI
jgi:hypothetical protein